MDAAREQSGDRERRVRAEELLGSLLAERFEVRRLLGIGSYGEVYQVQDRLSPSWPLAIKLLGQSNANALYRFKREFRALAHVVHPNLARLHELYLDGTGAFFTMELVDGVDFFSYVRPGGVLSRERLVRALHGLCEGVGALHASGRLHRDLKPSNVLVDKSGRVVIVDFGLATLFEGGESASSEHGFNGTVQYAAPEQLLLGKVGPASDCYALGIMLYEALSGSLPWEDRSARLATAESPAVPPLVGLPAELSALGEACLGMLRADPAQRAGLDGLRAALGLAAAAPAIDTEHKPLFLGRAPQLAQLDRIFEGVERGAAAMALVVAPSGQGKTALVDRFLERLQLEQRAIVLRGRCYVNEELAYRALDGSVDSLSHYLCSLPPAHTAALLPRDARALSSLFPVLNRVAAIASAPALRSALDDRASLRQRAGAALRELLTRASDRIPLVLFIDDIQWDDPDSAWLLATVLGDPDPPAILLIATCRSDARAQSNVVRALSTNRPGARLLHEVELPPLSAADTLELALHACGDARADAALAARIASESGGHPLFALELARFSDRHGGGTDALAALTLDAAIRGRAADLSPGALRLLQLVCAAGHPLRCSLACAAVRCEASALHELVSCKLVSASGPAADDMLEVYHDRVREALLPAVPAELAAGLHAALADALGSEPEPRFDLVVEHYLAAGRPEQAARHALAAADQAAGVLAFHRVPALLTLAMQAAGAGERGPLWLRLAESYALVGRTEDAARAYGEAADAAADPDQRWELRSMAMWQNLLAGQYEQGLALLRELDAALGWRGVRPTVLRVSASVVRYVWSRVWGMPKLRTPGDADAAEQRRLRLAFRAGTGLIGRYATHAAHLAVVAFRSAAKLGETGIYAAYLSMHAATSGLRSGRTSARSDRLLREAKALADAQPDVGSRLFVANNQTAYTLATGQFERAERELQELAELPIPVTPLGSFLRKGFHEMTLTTMFWLGRLVRARVYAGRVIGDARELADLHAELGLRVRAAFGLLAEDDPEAAWSEWSQARELYPMERAVCEATAGALIGLCAGRTDRAELALAHARRYGMAWSAYLAPERHMYWWWWGGVAAARLAAGDATRGLRQRLNLAIWLLSARPPPFFEPFALWLRAARAFLDGELARGVEHLESARALFGLRGLRLSAASASHALAALHPDEGLRREHAAYAREVFEAEQVRRPELWVRGLLPGLPALPARQARD